MVEMLLISRCLLNAFSNRVVDFWVSYCMLEEDRQVTRASHAIDLAIDLPPKVSIVHISGRSYLVQIHSTPLSFCECIQVEEKGRLNRSVYR